MIAIIFTLQCSNEILDKKETCKYDSTIHIQLHIVWHLYVLSVSFVFT